MYFIYLFIYLLLLNIFSYLLDGWAFYSRQASIYKPWFPCSAGFRHIFPYLRFFSLLDLLGARIEDSDVGKPVRILGDRLSDFQTPFDAAALVNRSRHVSALAQGHNRTAEVASFVSYCPPRYGVSKNSLPDVIPSFLVISHDDVIYRVVETMNSGWSDTTISSSWWLSST